MEIAYSILEASIGGALKTHIMFRCNLNSKQVQIYVEFLVSRRLLASMRLNGTLKLGYATTDLGIRYMREYESLVGLVGPQPPSQIQVKTL